MLLALFTAAQAYFYSRTQSITLDEATTLIYSFRGCHGNISALFHDIHTSFYNLILSLWLSLSDFDLKYQKGLSLFIAVLSVLSLFKLIEKIYGRSVAWIAAALLAFSPLHAYYSQLGRSYGLNILAGIVSTYFYLRVQDRKDKLSCLYYLISAWCMVTAHIISTLIILVQWLHTLALAYHRKDRASLLFWLKLQSVFLLGFSPILWVILTQYHPFGSLSEYYSWVKLPQLKDLWAILVFWSGNLEFFQPDLLSGLLTLLFGAICFYGAFLSCSRNSQNKITSRLFALWLFFPVLFLFAYSYFFFPVYIYRGMTSALVPWCVFAALGLCGLKPALRWTGFMLLISLSLLKTISNSHTDMENWSGTQLYVNQAILNHERLFILPDYYSAPFLYYALRPCFFSPQSAECMKRQGLFPIREAHEILSNSHGASEVTVISSVLRETDMVQFIEQQKVRSGFKILTQDYSLRPGVLVWKLYLGGS